MDKYVLLFCSLIFLILAGIYQSNDRLTIIFSTSCLVLIGMSCSIIVKEKTQNNVDNLLKDSVTSFFVFKKETELKTEIKRLEKLEEENSYLLDRLNGLPTPDEFRLLLKDYEILRANLKRAIDSIKLLIGFIPDGWEMPLGYSQVVAQVKEELQKLKGE